MTFSLSCYTMSTYRKKNPIRNKEKIDISVKIKNKYIIGTVNKIKRQKLPSNFKLIVWTCTINNITVIKGHQLNCLWNGFISLIVSYFMDSGFRWYKFSPFSIFRPKTWIEAVI